MNCRKFNAQDFPDKVTEVYNAGYEKGKSEGGTDDYYDTFWDAFQQNGNRTHWNYAFWERGWTDDSYKPKYTFKNILYIQSMFQLTRITDTLLPLDLSNVTNAYGSVFRAATNLKTIRTLTVTSSISYVDWFIGCTALKNITFEGVIGNNIDFASCVKLSKESIENIIGCLSDTVSDKTVTFSATAVNNAFGSSESDEWLSLKASKKNWNISLI